MSTIATTPGTDREIRIFRNREDGKIYEIYGKCIARIYNCSGTYSAVGKEETDFLWLTADGYTFMGFDGGTSNGIWGNARAVYSDANCTEEFDPTQSGDSCKIFFYSVGNNWHFFLLQADTLETPFEEFTDEEYALWDLRARACTQKGIHTDLVLFLILRDNRAFVKSVHRTEALNFFREIESWDSLGPEIAAKGEDYEQLVINYLAEQTEEA
jgi:hypothetical protein